MFGLAHLLAPVATEEFWDIYWGEKALRIPGAPDKFPDLFGWEALQGLLNEGQTGPGSIRLVHDTQAIPPGEADHVGKWLKKGATLIINHLNRSDPVVGRLTDALARDLNTSVNTNCYTSWPVSQGFDLHYDGHDVFVVNVEGHKAWKVYPPTFPNPLERHAKARGPAPEDAEPYLACTLEPGDVLYIPRGHWHYALAQTPSLHLTIGAQCRTGADFLAWLAVQLGDRDEALRRDFPVARAPELGGDGDPDLLRREVDRFRERLLAVLETDALHDALLRYTMTRNPVRRFYHLPELPGLAQALDEETPLAIPPAQKVVLRPGRDGDTVWMLARGAEMSFEGLSLDLLRALLDKPGPWTPRQVLEETGGIDWPRLRRLLEVWLDHGIVRLQRD